MHMMKIPLYYCVGLDIGNGARWSYHTYINTRATYGEMRLKLDTYVNKHDPLFQRNFLAQFLHKRVQRHRSVFAVQLSSMVS